MDSKVIDKLLTTLPITKPYYHGCYLSDQLSTLKVDDDRPSLCCFVVNTLDSTQKRIGHFFTILLYSDYIIIVDSLGTNPQAYSKYIRDFLNHFQLPVLYFPDKIQSDTTCTCGLYAIYVCFYASSWFDILELPDHLRALNDDIITNWYIDNFVPPSARRHVSRQLLHCTYGK